MLAFFIILLVLIVTNALLLLFSLNSINKSAGKMPEFYVLGKSEKKIVKEKEVPAYGIYKKDI